MSVHTALAVSALIGSIFLVTSNVSRVLALFALVASGLEVLMALGFMRVSLAGVPLGLVLALAIAIPGVLAWLRASGKTTIAASTIVAFVGALQTVLALGLKL